MQRPPRPSPSPPAVPPHPDDCDGGYSQEEVDRFVAFLEASGQLGAVPDLPMLVRTSSVQRQHSFREG